MLFPYFCRAKNQSTRSRLPQYISSLLFGYIIGSVPTAYLLVKWRSQVDIRAAGTGNVGAMNTFDVTTSKLLGFSVFSIDMLKGVAATQLGGMIFGNAFWIMGAAGIGAVFGHNYPIWLKFKGGRGLATAVGITLFLGWIVVPVWGLVWTIHYALSKNIHFANITASLMAPLIFVVCPREILLAVLPASTNANDFIVLISLILLLVIVRHLEYIGRLMKSDIQ